MHPRSTSNPDLVAVVMEPKAPVGRLVTMLEDVRADGGPVGVLMDLDEDYELTVEQVGEWLAALITKGSGIRAFAVVARNDSERLLVHGMAVAARRNGVKTPIECFEAGQSAKKWLLAR